MPVAQGEVHGLVAQFRKTFPYPMSRDWNADSTAIPLQQDLVGDIRGKLILLLSSVAIVLLIACTNVAGLLLSRATMRRKEIALRFSLGAGRLRIVRQLLTESVLLSLTGGAVGIVLGMSALSIFKSALPSSTPGLANAAVDWQVTAIIAALALFTGLLFGLAPALSASGIDLAQSIRTGSQRSTATVWTRFRTGLIGVEVALTLVLVVSTGLLMRSLYTISEANPGFQPEHILSVRISPNQSACTQRASCIAFYDRLLDCAGGISGVVGAAVANTVPLDAEQPDMAVDVEGHPKSADFPAPMLWAGAISPTYIRIAMYMPYSQSATENGQIYAAMTLLVKTSSDSERLAQELRSLAEQQDPNVPVGQVRPLEDVVSGSISNFRSTIRVFLSFAAAAILLAAIGIYGLISYWVTQRTFEIGVRVALGAARHSIVLMVLSQGLRVAAYGIAAGTLAALAVTRFLASLLYGVTTTDPLTFAAVIALVLAVTVVATAVPAGRAARIDPIKSLRAE